MKKKRFSVEQIMSVLQQADGGVPVGDVCRQVGVSEQTFYRWKKVYGGGAIQWSLNRGLQLACWYFGQMNYVVPLYLQSRENITRMPDLIAPVQVSPGNLLVRTILAPHMAYANARVAVQRHDQLPAWLLETWADFADRTDETSLESGELEESSPH